MQVQCNAYNAARVSAPLKAQLMNQNLSASRWTLTPAALELNRCRRLAISKNSQRLVVVRAAEVPAGQDPEKFAAANKQYAELTEKIESASAEAIEKLQGTSVYLVGMMGSGKSTIGKLISQALGYCFFDSDGLIEQLAGRTIPEIFREDGEDNFRDVESDVLQQLMPFKSCVVATGGGAVIRPQNWSAMQQGGIVVWLNGPPALLAHRVVRDGTEGRPLLASQDDGNSSPPASGDAKTEYDNAVQRLEKILADRRELYSLADIVVSLEGEGPASDLGASAALVAYRVLAAINDRVARDAALREEKKNFQIVKEGGLPESMQVVKSINEIGGGGENADPYLP